MRFQRLLKIIGPGLLFASTAIGTSHLVLATRAGAHHGMIYVLIVLVALILKYPFFEFGPRYTLVTGKSLLHSYHNQGKWALILFTAIISINMFAVTGALAAVCAGLLSSFWSLTLSQNLLVALVLAVTSGVLLWGRFQLLDNLVKIISVVLFVCICTAFAAVLINGPLYQQSTWEPQSHLWEGAGLTLLVSLVGFMPTGMEAAAMNSLWIVEKRKSHAVTLREGLFDFNLGYVFTTLLAIIFIIIGAFTVYGSGELITGNSTQFSNKLLSIFSTNLGGWTYPILAMAAFGTIYGTLITAMDAFARCFTSSFHLIRADTEDQDATHKSGYGFILGLIAVGGFVLFSQFTGGMIKILEFATIAAFLGAPVIAFLNLKAVNSLPEEVRPKVGLYYVAYIGLTAMILFSCYYLIN